MDSYIKIDGFLLNTSHIKEPKEIYVNDKLYYRFMDWIYSPKPIRDLSVAEVNQICEIRRQYSDIVLDVTTHKKITDSILRISKRYVDPMSCLSILDFGSGDGMYYHEISGYFKNSTVYCCDMNEEAIFSNPAHFKYTVDPLGPLPFDANKFDIIFMIFVMHFSIPSCVLKEIHRCLTPNGYFIYNIYGDIQDQEKKDIVVQENGFIKVYEEKISDLKNHSIRVCCKSFNNKQTT